MAIRALVLQAMLVAVCLPIAASCLLNNAARAADNAFAGVTQQMQKFADEKRFAGAVTLVAENNKVQNISIVGLADLEKQRPMTEDTLFGIMSMTKPISATALMILVDEGKVSLDDPVEKYIPAFANAKLTSGEPVRGLTIRRLLTHTSGLVGDQQCKDSLEATANMLAARPFGFQPNDKWEYGPSINVIGRIIEIASGQPYDEFVTERILRPLAMNDTTYHLTDEQRERTAKLYKHDGDAKTLVPAERWGGAGAADCVPNPSGGLFSTAHDMFRFYQAILNGGELDGQRILSADAVKQMTSVQTGELQTGFTPGNGWGLGWCIVREPQDVTGMLSPGTFGHGGAFGTEGWIDPVKHRIFVLMFQDGAIGNSDGSDIRKEFQRTAVEALDKK